jgi:hypothetical protein
MRLERAARECSTGSSPVAISDGEVCKVPARGDKDITTSRKSQERQTSKPNSTQRCRQNTPPAVSNWASFVTKLNHCLNADQPTVRKISPEGFKTSPEGCEKKSPYLQ